MKALLKDAEEMSGPDLPHLECKITEMPPSPPDAASKHAVQAFFDCLRAEVNEYGISVSTISHTYISSSLSKHTGAAPARSIWSCEYKHIIATTEILNSGFTYVTINIFLVTIISGIKKKKKMMLVFLTSWQFSTVRSHSASLQMRQ